MGFDAVDSRDGDCVVGDGAGGGGGEFDGRAVGCCV